VPDGEWDAFMASLRAPLPTSFRINGGGKFAATLRDHLETDFFSQFGSGPLVVRGRPRLQARGGAGRRGPPSSMQAAGAGGRRGAGAAARAGVVPQPARVVRRALRPPRARRRVRAPRQVPRAARRQFAFSRSQLRKHPALSALHEMVRGGAARAARQACRERRMTAGAHAGEARE